MVDATNYALTSCGFAREEPKRIKTFIGYPLDIMFPELCNGDLIELKACFHRRAGEIMVDRTEPLPGAQEVLTALKDSGFRLAVATTKFRENSGGIFAKLGWENVFDVMAFGDDVTRVKPAPDIIELVLDRLGAKKEETLMVGDTRNDIEAARAAGVRCVAVNSPFNNEDLQEYRPLAVLPSLVDLLPLLGL
jgi:HAD superfamily hydrolase (TIGR01509 family)